MMAVMMVERMVVMMASLMAEKKVVLWDLMAVGMVVR